LDQPDIVYNLLWALINFSNRDSTDELNMYDQFYKLSIETL